jgi:hypothetical protein
VDRICSALCSKCIKLIVKYLVLSRLFCRGGGWLILDLDKYIFLWQMCFLLGGLFKSCLAFE